MVWIESLQLVPSLLLRSSKLINTLLSYFLINLLSYLLIGYFLIYFYSSIVAGTANSGFNIVLTAFLNAAWVYGAYHVIEKSKTPIAVCYHSIIQIYIY
jgi:hypothetical protein